MVLPKYSEMLIEMVEHFDDQLPENLTFEETLEIGIEAWNLANNEEFLKSKDLFDKELKSHKNYEIIEKMVVFKNEKFLEFNNKIVDYSTINNLIQVKTISQENYFNTILNQVLMFKPQDGSKK